MQASLKQATEKYLKSAELLKPVEDARKRQDYKTAIAKADAIVAAHPELAADAFPRKLAAMLHMDEKAALALTRDIAKSPAKLKQLNMEDENRLWGAVGLAISQ